METQFHTVRESLQAAFREQAESTETSLRELEEQTKKSFETLEASLRASAQEEWQARDEQRAEMVATMEQYVGVCCICFTCFVTVAMLVAEMRPLQRMPFLLFKV